MSEAISFGGQIDIRRNPEAERQHEKPTITGDFIQSELTNTYHKLNGHKREALRRVGSDKEAVAQIDMLDADLMKKLEGMANKHKMFEQKKESGYDKVLLTKCHLTLEEFKKLSQNIQREPVNKDFVANLKDLDKPLEAPDLEPIDLVLLASVGVNIAKFAGAEACKFVIDKGGKVFIGEQLVVLNEAGTKVVQAIAKKYKGFQELFEPHGMTTGGISHEIPRTEIIPGNVKGNISRMEGGEVKGGKIDFSTTKNSVLSNNYLFLREFGTMEPQEFSKRLFAFTDDLEVNHFIDDEVRRQSFQVMTGIKEYVTANVEVLRDPLAKDIKKDVLYELGVVRDKLNKIMVDKRIDKSVKDDIIDYLEELLEAKKLLN